MPKDRANNKPPINLAPSNSADCCATKSCSMAVRYAAHMAIPTMPTSMGFSVLNHKIPIASAQKITIDRPPNIESKGMSREDLEKITGGRTVPQIVIDGNPIGGYDDLLSLDSDGKLSV